MEIDLPQFGELDPMPLVNLWCLSLHFEVPELWGLSRQVQKPGGWLKHLWAGVLGPGGGVGFPQVAPLFRDLGRLGSRLRSRGSSSYEPSVQIGSPGVWLCC